MEVKINNGFVDDIFNGNHPVACLAAAELDKEELLEISLGLSSGKNFVLLVKNNSIIHDRLLPAFISAYVRYTEKHMRSSSLQKEILLFTAGTMNVGKAIKAAGISDNGEFIAFSSSKALLDKFIKDSHSKIVKNISLQLDRKYAVKVAMAGLGAK